MTHTDAERTIAVLAGALLTMLNVEGAALAGKELGITYSGLDVRCHFDKAREVLQLPGVPSVDQLISEYGM